MKTHTEPLPRTMAEENPPTTAPPVGADSITANPMPPDPQTQEQKQELDTQRSKPFQLTEANPTGAPAETRTVPKGRLISGSVGIGGENHPEDVKAIAQRLEALGIITPKEGSAILGDPASLGQHIQRYQQQVFNTVNDGLITAGGATENKLIQGTTTKAQQGQKPAPKAPEKAAQPQHDWKAAAQKIVASGAPAGTIGQTLATAHAPAALVAEVFPLLAENSTDNFAAAYCQALTDAQLAALPIPLKAAFLQSMGTGFVTPDEVLQLLRLKNSIQGNAQQGPKPEAGQKDKAQEKSPKGVAADGWTVGPLLSPSDYYSQLHPTKVNGVRSVPREVAFSGLLTKYDKGGEQDIYNDSKVKKSWAAMSITQREQKVYGLACYNTCAYILKNAGFAETGKKDKLDTLTQQYTKGSPTSTTIADTFDQAKNRLDTFLEAGTPVFVGLDGYADTNTNSGSATEHFVIIVGRGQDERGRYYTFFDVGRGHAAGYNLKANRLYEGQDFAGNPAGKSIGGAVGGGGYQKHYRLAEVRNMKSI